MSFFRTNYFVSHRDFASDAQTEVFDLPKVGIISNLTLKIEAQPGSSNTDIYLADILTKVEVIGDGSTVLKSYDGRQIQALQAYEDGLFPPDVEIAPSGWARGHFDIRFGRFIGDEKYALDCGAWRSLELKITYALTATGTIDTTGFVSGSGDLMVFGRYAPAGSGIAPVGYIKSEEKRTLTTTASTEFVLDLPPDHPYRRLALFCETHAYSMSQAFQYLTIDINEGAKKAYDRFEGADMIQEQALRYAQLFFHTKRMALLTSGVTQKHRPMGWTQHVSCTGLGNVDALATSPSQMDPAQTQWIQVSGSKRLHVAQWGLCPWGSLLFDLEKDSGGLDGVEAMKSAWDCTEKDDVTLKVIPSSGSLAISIVLEQYVPAPR